MVLKKYIDHAVEGFLYLFALSVMVLSLGLRIIKAKIKNFNKPKIENPVNPPECLKDGIYGEHKYITANNITFHYVEKGDPKKPLMLFVHGFPEFWYSWRYQILEFSSDYWTVAIDLRGYGNTSKPSNLSSYKLSELTIDLKEIIKKLGKDKCILVAHDWGAVLAWQFVIEHMDMVSQYIMMGAPSKDVWLKCIQSYRKQFFMSLYILFFHFPILPEWFIHKLGFAEILKYRSITNEDLAAFNSTFSHPGSFTCPLNYYRSNLRLSKKISEIAKFQKCPPGLYILGEKDAFISQKTGEMMMDQFDNLKFEIVWKANHFVQQDDPDKTNELMREFLLKNK